MCLKSINISLNIIMSHERFQKIYFFIFKSTFKIAPKKYIFQFFQGIIYSKQIKLVLLHIMQLYLGQYDIKQFLIILLILSVNYT